MADTKRSLLYSTCVAVLGFVCLVVGATAVGLPVWGYFDTANGELQAYSILLLLVGGSRQERDPLGEFRQVGGLEAQMLPTRKQAFLQRC